MISVYKHGVILSKTDESFEEIAVLNPALIRIGKEIKMLYRAVSSDHRSSIGICTLKSSTEVTHRNTEALLVPEQEYEQQGIEDPRIVCVDSIYYLTYTAYDGTNALGALASSKDLVHWNRHGIMVPQITYHDFQEYFKEQNHLNEKYRRYNKPLNSVTTESKTTLIWDKNVLLFPRKINGKFCFLHRIKPDIQIVLGIENIEDISDDFWRSYFSEFDKHILMKPIHDHEVSYIGGGCPPIETKDGWLLIYHGVHDTIDGFVYSVCAALLNIESPCNEIARLPYPLFYPDQSWEINGEVNNVCFPTGTIIEGDTLYIYYGAADEQIAVASTSLSSLLLEVSLYPLKTSSHE